MKKQFISLLFAGAAALCITGCGDSDPESQIPPPSRIPMS